MRADDSTSRRGRPKVAGLAEKRRAEIVEAAYAVFTSRGYETATVADVARHGGIGQATIYRYVGGKRELLDLVFDHAVERLLAALEPEVLLESHAESLTDMADQIVTVGKRLLALLDEDPDLMRLIGIQSGAIDKDLKERVIGLEATLNALTVRALGNAVEAGWLEIEEDRRPIVARLLTSLSIPGVAAALHGSIDPPRRALLIGTARDIAARGMIARTEQV